MNPVRQIFCSDNIEKEVMQIYKGVILLESKCNELQYRLLQSQEKLNDEKYQALYNLHRTLLHEHCDFLMACFYPSASPELNQLAKKRQMPARLW
jgi:hypothetical protein